MIEKLTLKELLGKYKINQEKISSNPKVLKYGEYDEIDKTLDYLINELKIDRKNIEKCPSIIYFAVYNIKNNIKFLKDTKVKFSNVETCLSVLSTETKDLIDTYDYVKENYGLEVINDVVSILRVPKEKIINIEKLKIPFKNKKDIISVAIGKNDVKDIKDILGSEEYKKHPELFTSQTLAYASLQDIKDILGSEEYKKHPELFTSETLAYASLQNIKDILGSEEYKKHPELFTSQTLAHASLQDIKDILGSEEYKKHPELFTSETLAHASLQDIKDLFELPYWEEEKYKKLLTSSLLAKGKMMITRLPILFEMALKYGIENHLNTSFLLFSPSQNYALINFLIDNGMPLIIEGKLNPIFGKQSGVLKKRYNIDLKELIKIYPFENYEKTK